MAGRFASWLPHVMAWASGFPFLCLGLTFFKMGMVTF